MNVQELLQEPYPEVYLDYPAVVLDFETTNIDYGSALNPENYILMSVLNGDVHLGDWDKQQYLMDIVEGEHILVAHNAKFELQWLKRIGADLTKILVWDTMIAEYVIMGNRRASLRLGDVAKRYGLPGKPAYTDVCMSNGVCPSELPTSLVQGRCKYDVAVTRFIFEKQLEYCKEHNLLGCVLTRCLLTPVLADIEMNGMNLDRDVVMDSWASAYEEYLEVSNKLQHIDPDVNFNSGVQLGELLYDTLGFQELTDRRGDPIRTGSGRPKTDLTTISQLKAKTKEQKNIKELLLRQSYLNAQLTKALTKMKECLDNNDLLYAQFNQCVTRTHRLSSSGTKYKIQFQNMAREHKKFFIPRNKGWLMGEVDGAQLEFRVAGFMGNDSQAAYDIVNGVDVHTFTSETITAAGQKTNRQEAKAHTFKPLYGGESGTKAEQAYYKAFKEKYKGVAAAQNQWISEVLCTKQLVLPTGLVMYWPEAKMIRDRCNVKSNVCNYPVQNLATAEIIPIALVYLWHSIKDNNLQSIIVNTVHDSAILEIHPDEVDIIKDLSIEAFTTSVYVYLEHVYGIDFNTIPLGVGIKIGERWSLGEEIKLSVEKE